MQGGLIWQLVATNSGGSLTCESLGGVQVITSLHHLATDMGFREKAGQWVGNLNSSIMQIALSARA